MPQDAHTAKAHADRVKAVSKTVRQYYEQNVPFRIFHGASNSTRAATRQQVVDISALHHVLGVDREGLTALVEPGVAMDRLVKYADALDTWDPKGDLFNELLVTVGKAQHVSTSRGYAVVNFQCTL
ncbi:hypothetical protein N0V95_005607 [Ascochyta clinopodiicola]|nr:hypothetical protein N0V95_005607 [Ascochyta clinopodiicola]